MRPQPGLFDSLLGTYGMGERVLDVIGRTAPQCIVSESVATLLRTSPSQARAHFDSREPWDDATRPPAEMVNQAILGGIAMGMFDLAKHQINERARGRTVRISPEEIRDAGIEGLRSPARIARHPLDCGEEV